MKPYLLAVMLLAYLPAAPLSAQIGGGADLTFATRYVWRGLRRSAGPVLQPSAFLSVQPRGWTFTTGAWSNIDLAGDESLQENAMRTKNPSELDYWLEAHTRRGALDLRLGTMRYDFREDNDGQSFDTGEVYGAAALLVGNLSSVGLFAAYDYAAIRGSYFELDAAHYLPVAASHGIMLSGLLRVAGGANIGQEAYEAGERGHFDARGITHFTSSFAVRVHSERSGGYIAVHQQIGRDPATQRFFEARTHRFQHWLDAGIWLLAGPPAREQR